MQEAAERETTYEDLLKVPKHLVAEILNDRLVTRPRPAPRHAVASSALGIEVGDAYFRGRGGPGGWWILDEPELHLGPHVLVPDLAGWRRERMPELPETAWFELAPDWVCEILSSSTCGDDRVVKMPLYAREGVGHIWLVDPDRKTIEAYVLQHGRWLLHGAHKDQEKISVPPFEAMVPELSALWV